MTLKEGQKYIDSLVGPNNLILVDKHKYWNYYKAYFTGGGALDYFFDDKNSAYSKNVDSLVFYITSVIEDFVEATGVPAQTCFSVINAALQTGYVIGDDSLDVIYRESVTHLYELSNRLKKW